MIYISGDIHGEVDKLLGQLRKSAEAWAYQEKVIVFLLGDVGVNFFGDQRDTDKKELLQNGLNQLMQEKQVSCLQVICIRGNHDCRPQKIGTYHKKMLYGAWHYVEEKYPELVFPLDGEVLTVEGHAFLILGGGNSSDWFWRQLNSEPWFDDEGYSPLEIKKMIDSLQKKELPDDLTVLSHMLPQSYAPIPMEQYESAGPLVEEFLDQILILFREKLIRWFTGHYHQNLIFVREGIRFEVLYKKLLLLES